MRNQAVVKLFVLSLLLGLSLIPLGLIWGVVADRARYRDRVVGDVAQSSARAEPRVSTASTVARSPGA